MKKVAAISPGELIEKMMSSISELLDNRKGKNKKYRVEDALLSAFSLFFMNQVFFAVSAPNGDEKGS